jgi:hypothetical protein
VKRKTVLQLPASSHRYAVVERVPPLPGEPEYVVYEDGGRGDAVAHFFNEIDAQQYAEWRSAAPSLRSLRGE